VDQLRQVFTEVARVLNPAGTVWLHLADHAAENLPGIPWRVVFALQADGWILRNTIVCHPRGPRADLRDRRLANRHDLLFLLTREPRYHLDIDPLRNPYTGPRSLSRRAHRGGTRPHGASTDRTPWPPDPATAARGGNPGDVWTHPAPPADDSPTGALTLEMALRAISAGCPPRGLVLDPFAGAQTTGLAARRLDRRYIGISSLTTENRFPSAPRQAERPEGPVKKASIA